VHIRPAPDRPVRRIEDPSAHAGSGTARFQASDSRGGGQGFPARLADARQPPEIRGTGYVVDALEAALWAFWDTDSFEDGVLAAVNLGDGADTTGAICGQLAGAFYGLGGIPEHWRGKITLSGRIGELADALLGGQSLVVHCRGGLGRTGVIAARLLIELGEVPSRALQRVRLGRPGAVETREQETDVLERVAQR